MNRTQFVISLLLILIGPRVSSQDWDWYKHFANPGNVSNPNSESLTIYSIEIDQNNDIVVFGHFIDSLIVEGATYESSGAQDVFLAKYSELGTIQWFRILGGIEEEISGTMTLDDLNNIYITGAFRGTLNFQGSTLTADHKRDVYLAKFNSSGNMSWLSHAVGGNENQVGFGLAIAPNGEIYLSGTFKDEAVFDSQTFTVQKSNINNFIAKYDVNGAEIWSQQVICSNTNTRLFEIEIYKNNEIYLAGFFTDTLEYFTQQAISRDNTTEDIILLKIDDDGQPLWARQAGSTNPDRCNGLSSDQFGSIYATGYITSSATFDSTALGAFDGGTINSNGGYDMFVTKYNKNGTLQWVSSNGSTGNDIGYGVSTFENIVQFSGYFSDQVIFNQDTLNSSGISDENTGFFVYNTSGDPINGREMTGLGEERGSTITFDVTEGATYIGGTFTSDTLTFGPNQIVKLSDNTEGFMAKYLNPYTATFTTVEHLECAGDNTGRLIVTPYFGVAPYAYTWSPNVTSSNDSLASNLIADTYSVTITDSRGETAANTIELTEPPALALSATSADVSCHPASGVSNNGTIDITVSGGTGGYSYLWSAITGSGVAASAEDQTTLTQGQYQVQVTDENGCTLNDMFTINQPDRLLFTGSTVTNATGGSSNGAIDLTVSGGNETSPYTEYAWTNEDLSYSATTEDITGLAGDNYYVTVTDNIGCEGDTLFVVEDATLFIATISNKTDVDCKGDNTGSATVSTTGRTGPFTYSWSNGGNGSTINDLTQGTYYVTVTDDPTIDQAITSVQIQEPDFELVASISGTDLICYQDNSGIADLSVSGGTLPYAFSWNNGSNTEDISGLEAGSYSVTITDDNNCITTASTDIDQPSAMDLNISVVNQILCNGENTGVLNASATGGTGTKSYVWDDPGNQTLATATDLLAGIYNVTATDIEGCQVSGNEQLLEPAAINISPSVQDVDCFGNSDGIIALSVTGGTSPFNYQWSNGQINQNIQYLEAGSYTVTVTDVNNCTETATANVQEPAEITFQSVTTANASCAGYSDGEIVMNVAGGAAPFGYSIDGGTNYGSSNTFADLAAQNYTLKIQDNNLCESADSVVAVNEPEGISIASEFVAEASCAGVSDGSITIEASSPVGGLTYSIDGGANFVDNGGLYTALNSGNYQVQVMDMNGCVQTGSLLTVGAGQAITISAEEAIDISCYGMDDGRITITASSPAEGLTYSIDNGNNFEDNGGEFSGLTAGSYNVQVSDANGCTRAGSSLEIMEPEALLIDTTITDANGEQPGSLEVVATGGTSPYEYVLTGESDSLSNTDGLFTTLGAGSYSTYALDANSCQSEFIELEIEQLSTDLIIYEAFSPNNDGINDTWNIANISNYPNCTVAIFSSWGTRVFSSDGYSESWDGNYNGKELPSGTYYYVIDPGDGTDALTGPVSLVR